jgi:hypothetical protein
MNADGFELIAAVEQGDTDMIRKIDRAAFFARTRKRAELVAFRSELATKDITAEALSVHLLSRLVDNLS